MVIRRFKKQDAEEVSKIIKKNLIRKNNLVYPPKTIEVLLNDTNSENLIKKSKTRNYFVAIENEEILGIGGYEKDDIHTFFVNPKYHRKGIGSKLLVKILEEAKKQGINTINCASTPHAESFYKSFGFKRIEVKTVMYHNEPLRIIVMTKKL